MRSIMAGASRASDRKVQSGFRMNPMLNQRDRTGRDPGKVPAARTAGLNKGKCDERQMNGLITQSSQSVHYRDPYRNETKSLPER
jgi:hypothetical protein